MSESYGKKLPSLDDVERIVGIPSENEDCDPLCRLLNDLWDERQTPTDPAEKRRIDAEIRAVVRQMKALRCPICLPV
jgi:hypothetical protein